MIYIDPLPKEVWKKKCSDLIELFKSNPGIVSSDLSHMQRYVISRYFKDEGIDGVRKAAGTFGLANPDPRKKHSEEKYEQARRELIEVYTKCPNTKTLNLTYDQRKALYYFYYSKEGAKIAVRTRNDRAYELENQRFLSYLLKNPDIQNKDICLTEYANIFRYRYNLRQHHARREAERMRAIINDKL